MGPASVQIGSTTVELYDPRVDPEPPDWSRYRCEHRLPPLWSFDLVAAATRDARSPATLALVRTGPEASAIVSAVVSGTFSGRSGNGRYPRVGIVDVRLPGTRNTPWHIAPGADRGRLLRAFERAAFRYFGPGIRGVLYRAVPDADVPPLAGRGRPARRLVEDTRMALPHRTKDEWLASLGRSRRQDLRRRSRIVRRDPDLRVQFGFRRTDLDPAELAELLRRHLARLSGRFSALLGAHSQELPTGFFARVVERDDIGLVSYHSAAGRLLAFGTLLDNGDWPTIAWWAALTPEEGGRQNLYFDHYVQLVEWCIDNGRRGINGGRGMPVLKASLGFETVPMHVVAAPRWVR